MMQRTFDLTWRSSRRLGGNSAQKGLRAFWVFIGYIFRGHGKKAHGYIFRGLTSERDRLHFSGFGSTLTLPSPCSACVNEFLIEGGELIALWLCEFCARCGSPSGLNCKRLFCLKFRNAGPRQSDKTKSGPSVIWCLFGR